MTQTILDISLSLGFATAANIRPEEPMGDGQGWVYMVVDDARDREGNLWSFGTMSVGRSK